MLDGVKLVRIDYRLIHGQVITKWSNKANVNRIVVVNDELAKDSFMAQIYTMAAPPGIKVEVVAIENFVKEALKVDSSYNSKAILVLFKNIIDAKKTVEAGVKFNSMQIGGLGAGNGRKMIVKGISIDRKDAEDLLVIQDTGVEVNFQVTPEENRVSLNKAVQKLGMR
ncbi:PTS system mannose/fructose/N-acetylgalactosamine-transporter subunit IIB [Sporolactobacillus sp. KGMB 08714]|uniref:PTS system mannose/fructose/N-acetylgalactosamine-transporter subunit IIB n=1 Tax=Sporolactobacillus sp. KGMB 08714 TaxID=3064704 RepID=UPI002FBEB767